MILKRRKRYGIGRELRVIIPELLDYRYGYLYNPAVVMDNGLIASTGWKIPTTAEYSALYTYLGGEAVAGGVLKSIRTDVSRPSWLSPNTGATDLYNFFGLPNGARDGSLSAGFTSIGAMMHVWTGTFGGGSFRFMRLKHDTAEAEDNFIFTPETPGMGIRLARDYNPAEGLADGDILVNGYQGNDGKLYDCVKIGDLVFTRFLICETQFRNGQTIPEVKDGTAWLAADSPARCSYNNDESNAYGYE